MLQKVKRGLLDVATSRKRLEMQGEQLQAKATKLHEQAKPAMEAGREDLAREALTRRAAIEPELESLKIQHAALQAEEAKLTEASKRLQAHLDALRTRKETIKATYTAAEAQTKVGEALSGLSEDMGDIGAAVQRAEDKTATHAGPGRRHRRAAGVGGPRRPVDLPGRPRRRARPGRGRLLRRRRAGQAEGRARPAAGPPRLSNIRSDRRASLPDRSSQRCRRVSGAPGWE